MKMPSEYNDMKKPLRDKIIGLGERSIRKSYYPQLLRLNRELRAISNCNVALMRAEEEQALLEAICQIVCDEAGYRMAWVGYRENDEARTIRPVAWAGVEDGYLAQASITWADTEHGRGSSGRAMRSGKSVCFQDFTTEPGVVPWREAALQRGYRSCVSLPLKDETAHTFGIFTIYSTESNAFTQDELRLLEELAENMAFGITVLRTRSERQKSEAALHNSQLRLNNIVANSPGAIYRCLNDREWTMEFLSAAITRITDYPAEDFLDNRIRSYASIIHPDDRRTVEETVAAGVERKQHYEIDYRIVAKDGSIRWVHEQGLGVFAPNGRLLYLDGVIFDVTDQRRAEEEILQLNQELEQRVLSRTAQLEAANKELEAFAYSISHDLRAPLRHINGFIELLKIRTEAVLDEKQQHYMDSISSAANKMGQLIDNLLSFSQKGRQTMFVMQIDLGMIIRDVIEEIGQDTSNRNITWKISEFPVVSCDAPMIRIVLMNLLSNAVKFTRPREQAVIEICCQHREDEVMVLVRDNGVGFDPKYIDRLFGVFRRLHSEEEFEGTGIGLATVQRIIIRHGGRVWAEGKVGEGATFYFTLPRSVGEKLS